MIPYVIGFALLVLIIFTGYEFRRNSRISKIPSLPQSGDISGANIHDVLSALENHRDFDLKVIDNTCEYINKRYDCSDFRMQSLIRMQFNHSDNLPCKYVEMIKTTLLGSKFHMDQPGQDSMCYWSENHLMIFATAEYLIGQLYPDEVFPNDGLTGTEHKEKARKRIEIWLSQRFTYGFTEWYSNTYYEEDIGPLANLIEFCDDNQLVTKAKMIMDLLLYDISTQSHKGSFTSTSGRQYEMKKKAGIHSSLRNVTYSVFGYNMGSAKNGLDQNFIYMKNYSVPEVIKEIGHVNDSVVIKASSGLDVDELIKEFPKSRTMERIMMQWAMECFTNPEVITATVKYIHNNNMLSNEFLHDFKLLDLSILKFSGIMPIVSRLLRPVTDGIAIQRANTYTFRTEHYMLATAQKHHPGEFADQQHIWSATLSPDICVFTTHPATPPPKDGAKDNSPGYWVGNGINPHSVQEKNINISIYDLSVKKGFMEKKRLIETHCYFPFRLFDETKIKGSIAFGKVKKSFIAIIGNTDLEVCNEELKQYGNLTYWITELSSADLESFDDFKARISNNEISYETVSKSMVYKSMNKTYQLTYAGDFIVNNNKMDLQYKRFDSPFSQAERKDTTITISYANHRLFLDFDNCIRIPE